MESAMKLALLLMVLAPLGASAQNPQRADPFVDLRYFVGSWEGTGRGQSGEARVERQYELALGAKFIKVTNRSSYPPQEKNPKGEVHEDVGMMSFDKGRSRVVFRQFHVEGFVNQYVLEPTAPGAKRFVLTTEAIENIPTGWRARETYTIVGPDEFLEVFELAAPGKEFETYSESRLRRKK
jgi:hypothetical protein